MLTRVFNFTEKMLNFTQYVTYKGPLGKSVFLKIVAQAFEAGYSLKILLRFSGFWGSFSYKKFSYKKKRLWRLFSATSFLAFRQLYKVDLL